MSEVRQRWEDVPLRLRLTLWYVLLLALTVLLFGTYLHLQLDRRLVASTDAALEVMAVHLLGVVDEAGGRPTFELGEAQAALPPRLDEGGIVARLLAPDGGRVWDGLGDYVAVPHVAEPRQGYTERAGAGRRWRVLTQPMLDGDEIAGWLEVAHALETLEAT
jgi:hypothetical protein